MFYLSHKNFKNIKLNFRKLDNTNSSIVFVKNSN